MNLPHRADRYFPLRDIVTRIEQQSSGSKFAFRFSLVEAFVAHKRTLLITNQAADLNALEDTTCPTSPYTWEEDTILGRTDDFIWRNFRSTGSHCKILIFINDVQEAFEISVACNFLSFRRFNEGFTTREDETHKRPTTRRHRRGDCLLRELCEQFRAGRSTRRWFHTGEARGELYIIQS